MPSNRLFLLILLFIFSSTFAGTNFQLAKLSWYSFLFLGISQPSSNTDGSSVTMAPPDAIDPRMDTVYKTQQDQSTHLNSAVGIGVGYAFSPLFLSPIFSQHAIELSVQQQETDLDGNVSEWIWGRPTPEEAIHFYNSHNAAFQYQVDSTILAINYLMYFNQILSVEPYVKGGIGVAQNKTQFSGGCNATGRCAPADAQYMNNYTSFQLSYDFGFGISKTLNQYLSIMLDYQLTSLGSVKSGSGAIVNTTADPVVIVNVPAFTNTIYLNTVALKFIARF